MRRNAIVHTRALKLFQPQQLATHVPLPSFFNRHDGLRLFPVVLKLTQKLAVHAFVVFTWYGGAPARKGVFIYHCIYLRVRAFIYVCACAQEDITPTAFIYVCACAQEDITPTAFIYVCACAQEDILPYCIYLRVCACVCVRDNTHS